MSGKSATRGGVIHHKDGDHRNNHPDNLEITAQGRSPKFTTRSPALKIAERSPAEALRAIGPLLYGAEWKAPTGRLLGVSDRSIRYWLAGQRTPPERIIRALDLALWERLRAITDHLGGRTAG